jgi:hypothetical protein
MPSFERIRQAIEAPVGEAEKLLNELKDADGETKLSILMQPATEKQPAHAELEEAGDEGLTEEAKRSREQTAELQEQTRQARRELEG